METEALTEYIRKAFEFKALKNYKKAVDYFYKALTLDNNSSEIMCELACLYEQLKKPDRAIEYFNQALSKKPDDERIKYKLACVLRNNGDYSKASKVFRDLYLSSSDKSQFFHDYIYVLLLLGDIKTILNEYEKYIKFSASNSLIDYYMGLTYENMGQNEKAKQFYASSMAKDSSNYDAGFKYASLLFAEKEYDKSESILLKISKKNKNAYVFYLLGEIYFIKGNFDEAIKYLSSACKYDSKYPSYFYELATVYSLKGFLKEAEFNYLNAIKLDPNNLSYNYSLAYLYYTNNEFSKAERILDYILSINPAQPNALALKAKLLLDNNDIINADKLIKQSIEYKSDNDYAHFINAKIFAKLNWWEKAIKSIKKAIELKPDSLDYKLEYAGYLYNNSQYDKVIYVADELIKQQPMLIDALIYKSQALIKKRLYKEANAVLNRVFKLDSNSPKAHFSKGVILMSEDKYQSAVKEFEMSLETEPDNISAYEYIADCYFKNKDYDSAYHFYKEASELDISNAHYRHMMAKTAVLNNDILSAASNFIIAKRLEPSNLSVIKDYFNFLCTEKNTGEALSMLKDSKKFILNESDLNTINKLIKNVSEKSAL